MESFCAIHSLFGAMCGKELKVWCEAFSLKVPDEREDKIAMLMENVSLDKLKQHFTKDFLDEFCRDNNIPYFSKLGKEPLFEHIKGWLVEKVAPIKRYRGPIRRMARPSGRVGGQRKIRTVAIVEEPASYVENDNSDPHENVDLLNPAKAQRAAQALILLAELVQLLQ